MKRVQFAPAVVLVLAACSSTPQPDVSPPPQSPPTATPAPARATAFNAIGQFDFTTMAQGEQVNGMIEIVRLDTGALGGKMTTSATPDLTIRSVVIDGRKVTIETDLPDAGALVVILNFEADNNTFNGTWSLSAVGDSGTLTGKRKTM
jgi:NaMN:DMB phosphoribosyltransferase